MATKVPLTNDTKIPLTQESYEDLTGRAETHYSITRSTSHIPGLVQTPLAGPKGTPAAIIRIHAPIDVEVVSWTAKSEKGPPIVPSPYHPDFIGYGLNANRVLLKSDIGVVVPVKTGGGNEGHVWAMSGTFLYGAVIADPVVRDYYVGIYPFDDSTNRNYYPQGFFSNAILDQSMPDNKKQEFIEADLRNMVDGSRNPNPEVPGLYP